MLELKHPETLDAQQSLGLGLSWPSQTVPEKNRYQRSSFVYWHALLPGLGVVGVCHGLDRRISLTFSVCIVSSMLPLSIAQTKCRSKTHCVDGREKTDFCVFSSRGLVTVTDVGSERFVTAA